MLHTHKWLRLHRLERPRCWRAQKNGREKVSTRGARAKTAAGRQVAPRLHPPFRGPLATFPTWFPTALKRISYTDAFTWQRLASDEVGRLLHRGDLLGALLVELDLELLLEGSRFAALR